MIVVISMLLNYKIQRYASHPVGRMECVMLTLDTVTVLLDSLAPPVMTVGKRTRVGD